MKPSILPLEFTYENKHQHYVALNLHMANITRPFLTDVIFHLKELISLPSSLLIRSGISLAATVGMQYHAIDFVKIQHMPDLSAKDLLKGAHGGLPNQSIRIDDTNLFTISRDYVKGVLVPEDNYIHGNPVLAVNDGTVVLKFDSFFDNYNTIFQMFLAAVAPLVYRMLAPLGNFVVIRHDDWLYSIYGHLKQNSVTVKMGQNVRQGEKIAEVGNTGNSTQSHLHFQFAYTPSIIVPFNWSIKPKFKPFKFADLQKTNDIMQFVKDVTMLSLLQVSFGNHKNVVYEQAKGGLPSTVGFIKQ